MEELNKRVERIDRITDSPATRASRVWGLIKTQNPDLTEWDLLCFAVEYCGSLVARYSWLEDVAKAISKRVYAAHYMFEEYANERRREEHKEDTGNNTDEGSNQQV